MSGADAARHIAVRSAKNTPAYRDAEQEQIRQSAAGQGDSDESAVARMRARSAGNRLLDINRRAKGGVLGSGSGQ